MSFHDLRMTQHTNEHIEALLDYFLKLFVDNFWVVVAALFGPCFVGWIAWRNGYKTRRANACAEFRRVFLTELRSVYPIPADWPSSMQKLLAPKFEVFQAAVSNFNPYVPWWRRWQFKRAWVRFHNSDPKESDKPAFTHYTSRICFGNQTPEQRLDECKLLFYKDVTRLLSFANET